MLTIHKFNLEGNKSEHVSGNKCVRGLADEERHIIEQTSAPDVLDWQRRRTFSYTPLPLEQARRGVMGIPRVLQFFDTFQFWAETMKCLGFRVILSPQSSADVFAKGMKSIPVCKVFFFMFK